MYVAFLFLKTFTIEYLISLYFCYREKSLFMSKKILVIGASGQIGSELTLTLRDTYGVDNVVATDINDGNKEIVNSGIFEVLDAKDYSAVSGCIKRYNIDTVYLMAAMLSATAEKNPQQAWDLNMTTLFNVLNLAKDGIIKKIFWPSSIAVFGPTTPKESTPQHTICEPSTVYGISKFTGERWCEYYHKKYNVDVRSLRYPGIISYKTLPGGGTTDYAVDIYHKAVTDKHYDCFLSSETELPMMFMEDAIHATLKLMDTDESNIKIRSSYNLSGFSITPSKIYESIKSHIPEFTIEYNPDNRQIIADSWPCSVDDSVAKTDWNWKSKFNISDITEIMISQLRKRYNTSEEKLTS